MVSNKSVKADNRYVLLIALLAWILILLVAEVSNYDFSLLKEVLSVINFLFLVYLVLNSLRFIRALSDNKSFIRLSENLTRLSKKRPGLWILFAAGVGLYAELMVIRLQVSYLPLFGFFKNVSLLSCFLGLGVGYVWKKKGVLAPLVIPLISLQIIFFEVLKGTTLQSLLVNPIPSNVAMGLMPVINITHFLFVILFIGVIFVFNAICFLPLGHLAARFMENQPKLRAYSWNLIGSLLGIISFSLLSLLWTTPLVWFLIFSLSIIVFYFRNSILVLISTVSIIITTIFITNPISTQEISIYSPYHTLTVSFPTNKPVSLAANNIYFQRVHDFENIENEEKKLRNNYYKFPYLIKDSPKDVLVLGSGLGNDVASALTNSDAYIDAVEIDPAIMYVGKNLHPNYPYSSERVNPIIADGREFLENTDKKYDLIVYGLLDSHSLLSGKSGLRLDSYIYTVEAFTKARERLKPNGVISLSFATTTNDLGFKINRMLEEAFDGVSPKVFSARYGSGVSLIYIAGSNVIDDEVLPENVTNLSDYFVSNKAEVEVSTDDWPFFYMSKKAYPITYLILILTLIIVSYLLISNFVPKSKGTFSSAPFFLGAGFMLIETKAITELALYYGSTWIVISIVSVAILIMAFLANLWAMRYKSLPNYIVYSFLGLSLALGMGTSFLNSDFGGGFSKIMATLLLTLPIFFSGFAFSNEIKASKSVTIALAANLLGAMFGGFLEYNSMYFGYNALYILAIIIYLLAYLTSKRGKLVFR